VKRDLLLLAAWVAILLLKPPLYPLLAVSIPLVLVWGFVTLNHPSRVAIDETTVAFSAYGRTHRYRREDVTITVRRFLVKDRVLVRVTPAPPWQGRYWITTAMDGYEEVLRRLG
jgi:hypothetical protein